MENPNDKQVAGQHYRASYQHWDMIFDLSQSLIYFQGCATKYAARWRKKYSDAIRQIEDLEKVAHYVEKMLWLLENASNVPSNTLLDGAEADAFCNFVQDNDFTREDQIMLEKILFFENAADLRLAKAMAEALAAGRRQHAPAPPASAPAAPAPAPAQHFTPPRHYAVGRLCKHNAPTARRRDEVGMIIREMDATVEIKFGSLSKEGQVDYVTVDKHYVEIVNLEETSGMEHPFGYDAQQEG